MHLISMLCPNARFLTVPRVLLNDQRQCLPRPGKRPQSATTPAERSAKYTYAEHVSGEIMKTPTIAFTWKEIILTRTSLSPCLTRANIHSIRTCAWQLSPNQMLTYRSSPTFLARCDRVGRCGCIDSAKPDQYQRHTQVSPGSAPQALANEFICPLMG